jgi:hypothetical protein
MLHTVAHYRPVKEALSKLPLFLSVISPTDNLVLILELQLQRESRRPRAELPYTINHM